MKHIGYFALKIAPINDMFCTYYMIEIFATLIPRISRFFVPNREEKVSRKFADAHTKN